MGKCGGSSWICCVITGHGRSSSATRRFHGCQLPIQCPPPSGLASSRNMCHHPLPGTEDVRFSRLAYLVTYEFSLLTPATLVLTSMSFPPGGFSDPHRLGADAPPVRSCNTRNFCSQAHIRLHYNCLFVYLPRWLWTWGGQGAPGFPPAIPSLPQCLSRGPCAASARGTEAWVGNWTVWTLDGEVITVLIPVPSNRSTTPFQH